MYSSIVSFWITLAHSKEHKYHIFRQYWYTRNVPLFTNTGTFQYLGPQVYFFRKFQNIWMTTKCDIFSRVLSSVDSSITAISTYGLNSCSISGIKILFHKCIKSTELILDKMVWRCSKESTTIFIVAVCLHPLICLSAFWLSCTFWAKCSKHTFDPVQLWAASGTLCSVLYKIYLLIQWSAFNFDMHPKAT